MRYSLVAFLLIDEMSFALYFQTPVIHVDPLKGFSHRLAMICVPEVSWNLRNTDHCNTLLELKNGIVTSCVVG